MNTLKQLCTPRDSAFDAQRRDTVLDLSDLIAGSINPAAFFAENHITEGMRTLLEQSFMRLEGTSSQGIFLLKQAMGGGKTHNLLALGLLARHPEFRQQVMGDFYAPDASLGAVRVVAFSGRDSDAPYGIWGSIAEQLGKSELFSDLYAPLRAPGQKAWERLLKDETALILIDELPPYFKNARATTIGNSDLAEVTATALSNLLVAINREGCERVCLILTDLTTSYEAGSEQIAAILADFQKETNRTAMSLEPVRMNSDELYHILRKRLFSQLPSESAIDAVAQQYAAAIRQARQMDITNESPEQFALRVQASYPFHPAIRDLYARFRENEGFQQTRGLIRLMRIVTARLWQTGRADRKLLISAHDLDFNDRETRGEITQINSRLDNAIAHDIADEGNAVAERLDRDAVSSDAQDATRLLLISSLANVPNAVVGLAIPELIGYLAEPGRDLSRLRGEVLTQLATSAWYLHSNRDGRLYFRDVENLNAKLESLVRTLLPEQAIRELRERLAVIFNPDTRYCYQRVLALPAVDEIELEQERVTLVIVQPHSGNNLQPALLDFWRQATYRNRVAFLTGSRATWEQLLDTGKRLKAVELIIDELRREETKDNEPQMVDARELADRTQQNFYSAVRETFTTLWFPTADQLRQADLTMRFDGNRYSGEGQIVAVLKEKQKFTDEINDDIFRRKCEQRLFTQQSMQWGEIKRRAATTPAWQWHIPSALDDLKQRCLQRDVWREDGGFVDKGPFPQPETSVAVREQNRDPETGEVTLQLTAIHGDTIFYDVGAAASTASARLDGNQLKTSDLKLSFLAVDSTGQHDTGNPITWRNRITVRYRVFQVNNNRRVELRAVPTGKLRYTTDGSDPKVVGAVYDDPFIVPHGAPFVLAYAEQDGIVSDVERIVLQWEGTGSEPIDARNAATWQRKHAFDSTQDSYAFLEKLAKFHAQAYGVTVVINGEGSDRGWVELTTDSGKLLLPAMIESVLTPLRQLQSSGQVRLSVEALRFASGQDLLNWVADARTELRPGEVKQ